MASTTGFMGDATMGFAPAEAKAPPATPQSMPTPQPPPQSAPLSPDPPPGQHTLQQGGVDLKGRFQILSNAPLPQFDSPCAHAFEALEFGDVGQKCMAMVCKPGMPVREQLIRSIAGVGFQSIAPVLEYGAIDWPLTGEKRFVIIVGRPRGDVYAPASAATFPKMPEQDIIRMVAQPAIAAMRELHSRNLTFRGFRIDNLYWNDAGKQSLMFGESYSCPPGCRQSAGYEQIISAMCDPTARGEGGINEDIFSLGVVMLFLAVGKNTLFGQAEDTIIFNRIEEGSFPVYTGQYAIPAIIFEALRGMIVDDVETQWSLDDLEAWARGSRQAIKPMRSQRQASRPFTFAEKNFLFVPSLTYCLTKNWFQAGEAIRNKSLDAWLRRSLSDEKLADTVQATINPSGPSSRNIADDILVARTCIALDPEGPIRYRNFMGRIEGLGTALAMAQGDVEKTNLLVQMMTSKLPINWLALQPKNYKNYHTLLAKFEMMPSILDNARQPGFGMERCLYELNPDMPCQSEAFRSQYVSTPSEILPALEAVSRRADRPSTPIDRHLAAFIGARMGEVKDSDLRGLGPPADQVARILAMLGLLSKMQRIFRVRELPGLSSWCLDCLRPAMGAFKNIARRKRMIEAVESASRSGMINDLMQHASNEQEWALDEAGFKRAALEHATITLRILSLEEVKRKQSEIARMRGESIAVVFSGILTVFFLVVMFYLQFKTM